MYLVKTVGRSFEANAPYEKAAFILKANREALVAGLLKCYLLATSQPFSSLPRRKDAKELTIVSDILI